MRGSLVLNRFGGRQHDDGQPFEGFYQESAPSIIPAPAGPEASRLRRCSRKLLFESSSNWTPALPKLSGLRISLPDVSIFKPCFEILWLP